MRVWLYLDKNSDLILIYVVEDTQDSIDFCSWLIICLLYFKQQDHI